MAFSKTEPDGSSLQFTVRRAVLFCLLTFVLTWPIEWLAAWAKLGLIHARIPGAVQMLAALSPGVAAITLSVRRLGGNGIGKLLRPLLRWRVRPLIYSLAALFSVGACVLAYALISMFGQRGAPLTSPIDFFMYFLLILLLSALWEEIGWRGFLLPLLMQTMTSLRAAGLIGLVWGAWHLPIFIAAHSTLHDGLAEFAIMLVGCIAMSVILTWLYLASKGSLLLCVLFHNSVNAAGYYFFVGLPGASLLPLGVYTAILSLIAGALIPKLRSEERIDAAFIGSGSLGSERQAV